MTLHSWHKGVLAWEDGDTLCISVIFTWDLPAARKYAESLRHRRIRMGGPAVRLFMKSHPEYLADCGAVLDVSDYPGVLQKCNPLATRTSVGCIRMCKFCG